jgi:hypothetical protein
MTVSNMRRIGAGSKASAHLLAWVKDLVTVHELQVCVFVSHTCIVSGLLHSTPIYMCVCMYLRVDLTLFLYTVFLFITNMINFNPLEHI